jgi:flagellar biosynthesis/type III secretory pathway ATPase
VAGELGTRLNEPLCDAVRAIRDGHIIFHGAAGHYPAIDVLQSVSV